MILDVARDPYTKAEVQRVYAAVCKDLGIAGPDLQWSERVRNGGYRHLDGVVKLGPRCWRKWHCAIHELAHHVTRRIDCFAPGHHGPLFRETLEMVAAMVFGDPVHYAWETEYKSIIRWAAGGRKKK
jgi:hypothetical protein